uniref:AAA+ ATPase domain-containing protein n=1 Tax=Vertebrata isogona TaxID=2006944 RepID=A0A1Z1MES1_9FLOR|nr:hypothetical protein [Vertebrata isogona]ARW64483.1 hypothetical protein [Vertebrata isogona]
MLIADDLDKLLDILPSFMKTTLDQHPNKKLLIEIVMDLGRRPEVRFPDGPEYLSIQSISWADLDFCIKKIPNFSGDNRSGIECTLHRISSIKNRKGTVTGLTFRVGRAIFGTIGFIRDLLYTKESILLLGKPGVGKTTAIREITRVLSDEMQKRVVIIDTSNEIAGDGDIPHPAIGRARRMQVSSPELQHQVMIEAVENHMPEVIIIDEIGTELEALAARTIAERGVQLVGTAHGNCLDNVIKNPVLCDLVGGIQSVTLGDDEAKRRGSQKSILERKTLPAFQVAIEIHDRNSWVIHESVDEVVDKILQGSLPFFQRRQFNEDGSISIQSENFHATGFVFNKNSFCRVNNKNYISQENLSILSSDNLLKNFYKSRKDFENDSTTDNENLKNNSSILLYDQLYVYGINIWQVESAIKQLGLSLSLTRDLLKADYILGLKSSIKYSSKIRQFAKLKKITIYTIHNHNINSISRALKQIFTTRSTFNNNWYYLCMQRTSIELNAIVETRYAIEKIIFNNKESVQLLPRYDSIRNLQLTLINLYNLKYSVLGDNSDQKLIIYPNAS